MDFEISIKNSISFALPHLKMKYVGINLTKYVQALYEGKLQNSDEQNQRPKKLERESMLIDRNIVRMTILLNLIHRFETIPMNPQQVTL